MQWCWFWLYILHSIDSDSIAFLLDASLRRALNEGRLGLSLELGKSSHVGRVLINASTSLQHFRFLCGNSSGAVRNIGGGRRSRCRLLLGLNLE